MNWRKPVIFSLLVLSGSKIPKYLKEIERINLLTSKEQKRFQEEKLKALLFHSYENTEYYRKILGKAGVVSEGVVDLSKFSSIPLLTKKELRDHKKDLLSKDHSSRKTYENSSGGSTGEPVTFIQDKTYSDWNIASKIFLKSFAHQEMGAPEIRFWGSERDVLEGNEKLSIRLRNFLYNRTEFNTFGMAEKDIRRFHQEWNSISPTWIEAYVQSIHEFAQYLEKHSLSVSKPKGILTSAGTLYDGVKKYLEKTFDCRVYNRYGSREVGDIACSDNTQKGLRICFWNQFVEVIDGKIVVSNLNNYSMPLIRYEIGDVGELNSKDWKYLLSVKGRTVEQFKTKDGRKVDGEFFTHLFYFKDWIKQFQVIQRSYHLIDIFIVGKEHKKEMSLIEKDIKKIMGSTCKVEWNFVREIKPTKSGKYVYTISEVQ